MMKKMWAGMMLLAAVVSPAPSLAGLVEFPQLPTLPLPPLFPPPTVPAPPPGCTSFTVGMKVLIISANGQESTLPAIRDALDYHSVPHFTWIATDNPGLLTPEALATGCDGHYQGVILATGGLVYSPDGGTTWMSALTAPEWQALRNYETWFKAREIAWYVYPGADHGLNPPSGGMDTGATPVQAALTAAGASTFPTLNAASAVPITQAWMYLATAASPEVTPLLVDAAGNALVSKRTAADGRETLAMTFDSNRYLLHHAILSHGLVEWVTRGIYVGEFRAYLTPQVDDVYLPNAMYSGGTYRITPSDVLATHLWQTTTQLSPLTAGFKLALAFNGYGSGFLDPLAVAITPINGSFHFISHTFTHTNMNAMSYSAARQEIIQNNTFAQNQAFLRYSSVNLVTPEVSGLTNASVLRAARELGIRYTVSDASRPEWNNPAPNIGLYSALEPTILHVPRRATNLFYNVSTPAEWTAEYNALYSGHWGRNLTYAEILDKESQLLLFYMLRGDLDPQMYHQANLRAYDGSHSLLSDLHDLAIQKYSGHANLPLHSPDMHVAGARMADTMARNASGLSARLKPGVSVTFHSPVAVRFAVSGVCALGSEVYAGKCITTVNLPANQAVTLPAQ